MTTITQPPAVYWTVRRFNEPAGEWAARMAEQYAASRPAVLARLDRIGQIDALATAITPAGFGQDPYPRYGADANDVDTEVPGLCPLPQLSRKSAS